MPRGSRSQKKAVTGFKRKAARDKPVTGDIPTTGDKATAGVNQKRAKSTPQERAKTPSNAYSDYADFPWGAKGFDADAEFSGGRKVWGTSANPHTRKIRESHKRLLGPLLAFERAKDWKRQKIARALKLGVREREHATATGRPIGTARKQLTDVQCGKFDRLVQKTWEVMFIRKKAYILWQWYKLSSEQKRFYLELKGDDDVPDFEIPDEDLRAIRSKADPAFAMIIVMRPIDRTSYVRFDDLTEGIPVVLGGQNDALAIADRITLETLAAEAAEEVDADACASDEGVVPDSGVSYYLPTRTQPNTSLRRQQDSSDEEDLKQAKALGESDLKKASPVGDSEAEALDTDSDEAANLTTKKKSDTKELPRTAAIWSTSRLRQRRVPLLQEDPSSELIPSDPEDNDYDIGAAAKRGSSSQHVSSDSEE